MAQLRKPEQIVEDARKALERARTDPTTPPDVLQVMEMSFNGLEQKESQQAIDDRSSEAGTRRTFHGMGLSRVKRFDGALKSIHDRFQQTLKSNTDRAMQQNKLAGIFVGVEDAALGTVAAVFRFASWGVNKARQYPMVNRLEKAYAGAGITPEATGLTRRQIRSFIKASNG